MSTKTYAKAKKPCVPFHGHAMPTPITLASKPQYCEAMCRAGVQPSLRIGTVDGRAEREAEQFACKFNGKPIDGLAPAKPYSQASLDPGAPLSDEHKELFKPHVGSGVNLDKMRIYRNQSPDKIDALAYTHGNNIVLGPQCSMQTLAHEVCHAADHQRMNGCTAQGKEVRCKEKKPKSKQPNELEISYDAGILSACFRDIRDKKETREDQNKYKKYPSFQTGYDEGIKLCAGNEDFRDGFYDAYTGALSASKGIEGKLIDYEFMDTWSPSGQDYLRGWILGFEVFCALHGSQSRIYTYFPSNKSSSNLPKELLYLSALREMRQSVSKERK